MRPAPGDLLLFEKAPGFNLRHFYPFAIRLVTGNKIVHVGIVERVDDAGQIAYWDQSPGGVRRRILSAGGSLVAPWVARPRWIAPAYSPAEVGAWCGMRRGWPYSYRRILDLAWVHLVWRFRPDWEPAGPVTGYGNPQASVCSQFAGAWVHEQGQYLPKPLWMMEPDDFLDTAHYALSPVEL